MKMKQIAEIVNTMTAEKVGESETIVTENLDGIVNAGKTIADAIGWEQFCNTIVDKVGQVIMVSREYDSAAPDILRRGTAIPFGSVTEKVRVKLPKAVNNDSWPIGETWTPGAGWTDENKPTNDYANPFITVRPELEVTYFNGGGTFEVDMTYATRQNKSGFRNVAEYRRFFDIVESRIFQAKTVFKDQLTMAVIKNLISEKLYQRNAVIDILALYNAAYGASLSAAQAIYNKDFLRYAGYVMGLFTKRLRRMSRRYNAAGYDTFTPADRLRFVTLDMFTDAVQTFMQSDTYHDELVGLGDNFSPVESWQFSGDDGISFTDSATIDVINSYGHTVDTATMGAQSAPVYVVGTMFDVESAWQDYDDPRVTSEWNARKEQTTFFYKEDVSYATDVAENCVVFTLGSPAPASAQNSTRKK